jgi:hypothetical protein
VAKFLRAPSVLRSSKYLAFFVRLCVLVPLWLLKIREICGKKLKFIQKNGKK